MVVDGLDEDRARCGRGERVSPKQAPPCSRVALLDGRHHPTPLSLSYHHLTLLSSPSAHLDTAVGASDSCFCYFLSATAA